MAGTSSYRLLVEARINQKASDTAIQQQIAAIARNQQLVIGIKLSQQDEAKFNEQLNKIKQDASRLGNMTTYSNQDGNVKKVVVDYTNKAGEAVRQTIMLNEKVQSTVKITQDLGRAEKAYELAVKDAEKAAGKQLETTRKQADEMKRAAQSADMFLGRAQYMNKTDSVNAAIKTAQDIKQAVAAGDINKVRQLTDAFNVQKASVNQLGTVFQQFTDGMKKAMVQTIQYASSVQLLFMAMSSLREGVQYVSDLDKELTSIRMVTGFSAEEATRLGLSYNQLAKDLGATTLEVTRSSTEWFRQGKTVAETQELVRASMMMSKLANLDSAQSTEYLTSIINGFKLEATEVEDVLSKLVALDNAFASSTGEIASAMQRSSVSAQQAGVDLDHLAAMITVVSDVTRRAPESIGEAYKTMFARYQDILQGKVDEDGIGINNVAKALERVDINIRDAKGGFRDFTDILDEIYGKWESIGEVEQTNILKAMAGVRQREYLLVLLENEEKYRKAILETQNAQGLADDRYKIFLESVQASQSRMKAAAEGMWQKTINSEAIKFFYDLSAMILNLVAGMGGLQGAVLAVAVAFAILKAETVAASLSAVWATVSSGVSAFFALAGSVTTAAEAMSLLTAATSISPIGWIAIAIGAAVALTDAFTTSLGEAYQNAEKLRGEVSQIADNLDKLNKDKTSINELFAEFQKLQNATELTADEQERWFEVQSELKDLIPALNGHYDRQGRFIMDQKAALTDLIALKEKEIEIEQRQMELSAKKSIQAEAELYNKLTQQRDRTVKALNGDDPTANRFAPWMKDDEKIGDNLEQINIDIEKSRLNIIEFFSSLSEEQQKAYLEASKGTEIYNILSASISDALNPDKVKPDEGIYEPPVDERSEELEKVHDMIVDMIKDQTREKIEGLRDELKAIKDRGDEEKEVIKEVHEAEEKAMDDRKRQLDREYEDQKRLYDQEKDHVKEQLDNYKDIIDAHKELLNAKKDAAAFERNQNEKQGELARFESQIAELRNDTSEEGVARRLEIEEQANQLRLEMEEDVADRTFELQQEALDAEQQLAEEAAEQRTSEIEQKQQDAEWEHELVQRSLEDEKRALDEAYEYQVETLEKKNDAQQKALETQIDQLEDYLRQEGTISKEAWDRLASDSTAVYQDLLSWNEKYGTGVREDVVKAWEEAKLALEAYQHSFSLAGSLGMAQGTNLFTGELRDPTDPGKVGTHTAPTGHTRSHHSGVEAGFVGGKSLLKSNEQFAKLLDGELVVNSAQMDRFMTSILPRLAQTTSLAGQGNIEVHMPINVQGTLDKSVLPSIEEIANKAVDKINKIMASRGHLRRADSFGGQ